MLTNIQPVKIGKIACPAFFFLFVIASNLQADYVYLGHLQAGCADAVRHSAIAKPGSSTGKSKAHAYLNLARAISSTDEQSQKQRQCQYSSGFVSENATPSKAVVPTKTAVMPMKTATIIKTASPDIRPTK